jgi:hypothetical protein
MDETLRAYAKKRREQAEPALEMHPATRKLLQEEVKRTFGARAAQTESRSSWYWARWPLGALGGALAVLMLMFTVFHTSVPKTSPAATFGVNKSKQEEKLDLLTRNASPTPAPTEQSLSESKPAKSAAAPVAEPALAAREGRLSDRDARAAQENGSTLASTAPASAPLSANADVAAPLADKDKSSVPAISPVAPTPSALPRVAALPATASAGSVTPPTTSPPVRSDALVAPAGRYAGVSQAHARAFVPTAPAGAAAIANDATVLNAGDFVQVHERTRGRAAESLPSNVLSTFNLSRAGQNVRVIDADGSIYEGQVVGGVASAGATEAFAKKSQVANQDANWAFKVAGTNHNLQQNIVFTGNVSAMPVAIAAGQKSAQNRNAGQVQNAQSNGLAQSAQNSRIIGKVQVGDGKEIKIEAKPPPP